MKNCLIWAMAASTALAAPAMAQDVTGTVNITGSVASKCLVQPGAGDTFGTDVDFGELAESDGTLRTDLASAFSTIGGAALSARVVCTTANPEIAITATALATTAPALAGYDNSIDFTAHVDLVTVGSGGPGTAAFQADTGTPLGATAIGARLANNGSSNITISASNFHTNNLTDLLVADPSYSGSIVVVISPGA